MRRFRGLEIFTENLTNSGTLDERYARVDQNNVSINLNSGAIITGGQAVFNGSGEFYNGINVSGVFVFNGLPINSFQGNPFRPIAGFGS